MVSRWFGGILSHFFHLMVILFWGFVPNSGELLMEVVVLDSDADGGSVYISRSTV